MSLPQLVHSSQLSVISKNQSVNREPRTENRLRRGFSLIELLTVVAIIGILLSAATVSFTQAQKKGRDGKRKVDVKSIQQALELYFQNKGEYPPEASSGNWCAVIHGPFTAVKNELTGLSPPGAPAYINPMPRDPIYPGLDGDYLYKKVDNTHYFVAATLENTNDPERVNVDTTGCSITTHTFYDNAYQANQP